MDDLIADRPEWMRKGSCRGSGMTELFFPVESDGPEVAAAKAVCVACPVRETCLEFAITHGERDGVWGGLTERERRQLVRRRRDTA